MKISRLLIISLLCSHSFSFAQSNFPSNGSPSSQSSSERPLDLRLTREAYLEATTPKHIVTRYRQEQEDGYRRVESTYLRGEVIQLDTRDFRKCQEIQNQELSLNGLSASEAAPALRSLCDRNDEQPFVTVVKVKRSSTDEFERVIGHGDEIFNAQDTMKTRTRNVAIMGAGVMGLLYMMPESVTNWNKSEFGPSTYVKNIRQGPKKDKDGWMINYVGHPLSGAAYYMIARTAGSSALESFGYSVLMSTVFWEFGMEAMVERPSIQDLIATPVIGSLIGEMFFQMTQKIEANGGRLLGSKKLGSIGLFTLNPAGEISKKLNKAFQRRVFQTSETKIVTGRRSSDAIDPANPSKKSNYVGIQMDFKFDLL